MKAKVTMQHVLQRLQDMETDLCKNSCTTADEMHQIQTEVGQKLEHCKPTMMLYGVYNAGKSTLVNALFGKDLAKVSDKPETDSIHEYTYEGNTIYDTPGLNAPIEHEEVTQEHYKKCEMILFVLDTISGFEEKFIYDKLQKIFQDKKPLIVVLNDKARHGIDSKEVYQIRERIQSNLAKILPDHTSCRVITINAKSALKAKLENKNVLLQNSNIAELEHAIFNLFAQTDLAVVLRTCCERLENFMIGCKNNLDKINASEEIQERQKLINSLERQQSDTRIHLKNLIEGNLLPLDDELIQPILKGNQKQIEECCTHRLNMTQGRIEEEFEEMIKKSQKSISTFVLEIARINQITLAPEIQNEEMDNPQMFNEIVQSLKMGGAEQIAQAAKPAIEWGLQGIKQLFPELMKGIGPVTMGKMASKAVPFIGIGIQVLSSLYEFWNAQKAHEKRVEQERARVMEASQHAIRIREQMASELFKEVKNVLDAHFEKMLQGFRDSVEATQTKNNQVLQLQNKLDTYLNQVENIKLELTTALQ